MKYLKTFEDFEERIPITYWVSFPNKNQLQRYEDELLVHQDPVEWLEWKLNDFDTNAEVKRYRINVGPDIETSIRSKRFQNQLDDKEYWGVQNVEL